MEKSGSGGGGSVSFRRCGIDAFKEEFFIKIRKKFVYKKGDLAINMGKTWVLADKVGEW